MVNWVTCKRGKEQANDQEITYGDGGSDNLPTMMNKNLRVMRRVKRQWRHNKLEREDDDFTYNDNVLRKKSMVALHHVNTQSVMWIIIARGRKF